MGFIDETKNEQLNAVIDEVERADTGKPHQLLTI